MSHTNTAYPGKPEGADGRAMVARMNESHRPLREWAFPFLTWKKDMEILDVGCGGGATIADMLKLSEGSIIHGIDYSIDCVEASKETNALELGKRVFITRGDVANLPYEDESFTLVTGVETIYFWPELDRSLKEIHRVLTSDGVFAIINEADDPKAAEEWELSDLTIYRPEELEDALLQAGFSQAISYQKGDGYLLVVGIA